MSALNSRSLVSIIAISFFAAALSSPISTAAVAQNSDGSMDQMFNENDAKKTDAGAKKASAAQSDDSAKDADAEARPKNRILGVPRLRKKTASIPLTSVDAFARSPIVQGGGWPGVGPFKPGADDSTLVDAAENTIKIDATDQKQVTGVELQFVAKASKDFLGVQMTTDFLLEALGTKPARIADFNAALEKARQRKGKLRATISAGRYTVVVKPSVEDPNQLVVRVDNVETAPEVGTTDAQQPSLIAHPISKIAEYFANIKAKPDTDAPPGKKPLKVASATPAAGDATTLKDDVKSLIENWQKIKRNAVKNRDTTQLSEVLTGHALSVQTNGIKWLSDNHKYYEMMPRNVAVSNVSELEKDKKYSVLATVKESSKLYEEKTNKMLRDAEDTYLVNYTVEKLGDKLLISNSSIVQILKPQDDAAAAAKKALEKL